MEILDRIKSVVKWIIGNGYASNQKEVGVLLGYSNESSFSQIVNGKKPLPAGFVDKIAGIDERIDKDWINTGIGSMIKKLSSESSVVGEPAAIYRKMETTEHLSALEIIDRSTRNIERMIEIADRNSRSIEKMAESNTKLIKLLCNNNIVAGSTDINDTSERDD